MMVSTSASSLKTAVLIWRRERPKWSSFAATQCRHHPQRLRLTIVRGPIRERYGLRFCHVARARRRTLYAWFHVGTHRFYYMKEVKKKKGERKKKKEKKKKRKKTYFVCLSIFTQQICESNDSTL